MLEGMASYLPLVHACLPLSILLILQGFVVLRLDVVQYRLQIDLHVVIPCVQHVLTDHRQVIMVIGPHTCYTSDHAHVFRYLVSHTMAGIKLRVEACMMGMCYHAKLLLV